MNETQINKRIHKFVVVSLLILVILVTVFFSVYEYNNYLTQNADTLNNQSTQNSPLTPSQLTGDQKNQFVNNLGVSQKAPDEKAFKVLEKLGNNKSVSEEQKKNILNSL